MILNYNSEDAAMPKSHYEQGQSPQPGRRSRLGLEVLEDRTVLSVTSAPVISLQGLSASSQYDSHHILVQFRPNTTPHALTGTTLGKAVSAGTGLYEVELKRLEVDDATAGVERRQPGPGRLGDRVR